VFRAVFASFMALSIPAMGYAGVFSFVQDLFVTNASADEVFYHNSQTIPLLAANISPDPDADKGGPEVSFDGDGLALVSESGLLSLLPGEFVSATGKEESIYIVRPGDTLSQIAELFEVKADTIRWRNSLGTKEYIRAGQELKIPPADGVYHKVAKGDTLSGIAKKYSAETSSVKTYNGIVDATGLRIGDEIFVPGGKGTTSSGHVPVRVVTSVSSSPIPASLLGDYIWPVGGGGGTVTQGYGYTSFAARSGYYKNNFHGGVDIGAPTGTDLLAVKAGVVTMSQWYFGYGNLVEIRHNDGTYSRYGHNSKNLVKKGQKVVQGQVIALVGSTGRSTGPHVHFEVRDKNKNQLESNIFYNSFRNY
jgi:murein DD-endopeptidase MepM/ murein hydrolase activator NlpD